VSECALNDINKIKTCMCLNALYMITLKWKLVCVCIRYIWYYENEGLNIYECTLYDIIKMRACMCVNAPYMILSKW